MTQSQTKPITVTRAEARFYYELRSWAGCDYALRFIWQVLNSRPAIEGPDPQRWCVPSASEEGRFYWVDIELRVCDCPGFRFKHHCSHLSVADRAASASPICLELEGWPDDEIARMVDEYDPESEVVFIVIGRPETLSYYQVKQTGETLTALRATAAGQRSRK